MSLDRFRRKSLHDKHREEELSNDELKKETKRLKKSTKTKPKGRAKAKNKKK